MKLNETDYDGNSLWHLSFLKPKPLTDFERFMMTSRQSIAGLSNPYETSELGSIFRGKGVWL
jgi:hypothetical protein